MRNKLKIALIALVLSISALALAGWCEIDIRAMRQANAKIMTALTKRVNTFISQQKNLENWVSKLDKKMDVAQEELRKVQISDLIQECDLCCLREDNILPQGFLGVDLEPCQERQGVVIQKIHGNSPAQAAGLAEGDIILCYRNTQVWSKELLIRDIQGTRPLTPVDILVSRRGEEKRLMVLLIAKRKE